MILLYLFFFLLPVYSINPNHFHFSEYLQKKDSIVINNDISATLAYIIQPLNHTSPEHSPRFQQRYIYSEQFSLNKNTAFLYVSGPDDFNETLIKNDKSLFMKAAKRFGATVFALEHRYYGGSKPDFETFKSANLHHLNVYDASKDVISFIEYANAQFNLDPDVRWILWGSGYGGLIATLARRYNPVEVSGIVAISAPIRPELDFYKYNNVVEKAILEIGGGACYAKIKEGFREVQNQMNTAKGRDQLSNLFELDPPFNQKNLTSNEIQMFYLSIIAPFQQIVQYNDQFNLSIPEMCDVVNQSWDPVQVIRNVYTYLSTQLTGSIQPMKFSYEKYIRHLRNESAESQYAHQRLWQFQMCTEFGWFYTTNDNENGLFGSVVPTSLFFNHCFDIFPKLYQEFTATEIRDAIANVSRNEFFGKYSETNAVFINGEYDPWAALGKTSSNEFSVVTLKIPLESHLRRLRGRIEKSDGEAIRKGYETVTENIKVWITGPKNATDYVDTVKPWTRPDTGETSRKYQRKIIKKEKDERFSELGDNVPSKKNRTKADSKKSHFSLGLKPIASRYRYKQQNQEPVFPMEGVEIGTFRQRVDHFDNKNTRFFQQKYFKNSRFAQPKGPNFLVIGGEGPERGDDATDLESETIRRAKEYGGTVYVLEHRFYGDSLVDNNTDLTKLSSLQALYDLAEFIRSVNSKTNTSNPWITIGGSYSGSLSAWMREIFPELVTGPIASSAPMLAKTDFYEYMQVVEKSFLRYNQDCYKRIKYSFATVHDFMQTESGRDKLSIIFDMKFEESISELDKHYFFKYLMQPFASAAQYSGPDLFSGDSKVAEVCKTMKNDSHSLLKNIAEAIKTDQDGDSTPITTNYTFDIEIMKNNWRADVEIRSSYLWIWQTCTEFAFFQSLDTGKGIFGAMMPVNMYIQVCMDLFGEDFNRENIDGFVEQTNYKYGGDKHFRGTNVVFTNGDVDPWHALGLYQSTDSSVISYLINGSSHCRDLYPMSENDVPGLKIARKLVDDNISQWLKEAKEKVEDTVKKLAVSYTIYLSLIIMLFVLLQL